MSGLFQPWFFRREDESPDPDFYQEPRLTVHIDEPAIAAVTALYQELLPVGGAILDLMSSWRSHLPPVRFSRVAGLGMNADEMAANPQLTEFEVRDLNVEPRLPYADREFDGACVTVSVQYLTSPLEVFQEVNRVLRPGAPFVVTFSNRCFPTKAITLWRATTDGQHAQIVAQYFRESANWGPIYAEDRSPHGPVRSDPLFTVWARRLTDGAG